MVSDDVIGKPLPTKSTAQRETQVIISELLESPYPHCVIPPRFFDRALARLEEQESDELRRRGVDARRARV